MHRMAQSTHHNPTSTDRATDRRDRAGSSGCLPALMGRIEGPGCRMGK